MIDLHILNDLDSTTPAWLGACLASAERAVLEGLCEVYIIENPGPNVGAGRARAYRLGGNPYVAALDNDDVLMPDALPALLEALESAPELCGVYSDRQQIDADGNVLFALNRSRWTAVNQICRTDHPHQLAVFRRAAVAPHLEALAEFPEYADFVLAGLATHYGPWRHVPGIAYQRREKPYYVHHRRPIDAATRQRARQIAIPPLLKHLAR